jgi:hypothetical protein
LGGYRSGYARQYSIDDAWIVFIGGHLVAGLKFTIPEARQILKDLHQWFKAAGILFGANPTPQAPKLAGIREYQVAIWQETVETTAPPHFYYLIRGLVMKDAEIRETEHLYTEQFYEWALPHNSDRSHHFAKPGIRLMPISHLRRYFCKSLRLPTR